MGWAGLSGEKKMGAPNRAKSGIRAGPGNIPAVTALPVLVDQRRDAHLLLQMAWKLGRQRRLAGTSVTGQLPGPRLVVPGYLRVHHYSGKPPSKLGSRARICTVTHRLCVQRDPVRN